jgi:magnesium transporter
MSSIRPSGRKWNFNTEYRWNMPELNWPFGYLLSLGVMATIATGMIIFFKRKKWL